MALGSYLRAEGYRRVGLRRNRVGHFETAGILAGRRVRVLVDTGATKTVVSLALARSLGLNLAPVRGRGGGVGGMNLDIFKVRGAEFRVGEAILELRGLYAMDLGHVNKALAQKGVRPIGAILGADVLKGQAAVIDYGSSSLFLRKRRAHHTSR